MSNPKQKIAKLISTGFGLGHAPVAPGTFGTFLGIPIFYYMSNFLIWEYVMGLVVLIGIGVWAADEYGKAVGEHDHQSIVWDETVGYLITMTFMPATWQAIVVGVLVFRFFDILKPWPIHIIDQRVKSGFGTMLDDIVAGVFGMVAMMGINQYVVF